MRRKGERILEVRKIFRAGNSIVVSLPQTMLKSLDLQEGSHVSVEVNRERRELVLKPVMAKKHSLPIDFVRLVDKLFVEYDYALRRLNR